MALAANISRFVFKAAETEFHVTGFELHEKVSALFSLTLELAIEDWLPTKQFTGKPGLFTIYSQDSDRYVYGMIHRFNYTGEKGRFQLYQAELTPHIQRLLYRKDCRIFQDMNTPQIVRQVLQACGLTTDDFTFRLSGEYPIREYCVQYNETDFAFISRLLEHEGIYYFFEHSEEKELLVFADSTVAYQPIAGEAQIEFKTSRGLVPDQETIFNFSAGQQIVSGKYSHTDYYFVNPALNLGVSQDADQRTNLELYDYPSNFHDPGIGQKLAKVRLEQTRMEKETAQALSTCARLTPGFTFSLCGHRLDEFNTEYVITEVVHQGHQPQVLQEHADTNSGFTYANQICLIPAQVPIRPAPITPKPVVCGIQTAVVTGPKNEEIYPDKHSRIKVQFHWDRLGDYDQNSSCWLRCANIWAGTGWGAQFIPRIGHEVIITFLEGDPDKPLISGRVYHGTNRPPYDLPADKTKSTYKTDSSIGGEGCNEIRFEDQKDKEELFIQAQKDMHLHIKNDQKTSVGRDTHQEIKRDKLIKIDRDRHIYTHRNEMHQVGRDQHLEINNNQAVQISGNQSQKINGNVTHHVQHNHCTQTGQTHSVKSKSIVIEAMQELTVKVGSSFISINSAGVAINGSSININSGGSPGSAKTLNAQAPAVVIKALSVQPSKPAPRMPKQA